MRFTSVSASILTATGRLKNLFHTSFDEICQKMAILYGFDFRFMFDQSQKSINL